MKIKLLFIPLIALALFPAVFAQSVIIKPKKIFYTRKGKDVPKEKKTFDVTYPTISGTISPAAKKKLENTISYWRIFETTLQENLGEYHWLSELSYTVNYNKNGILDISLTQEGAGAYPDTQTITLAVDLKTGAQVKFADVFKASMSKELAALADKKLAVEKAEIIQEINRGGYGETNDEKEANRQQISELKFTAKDLEEFSIGEKGVTFIYDAGFPHVIQAMEPAGAYSFSWTQLKPFIRRDGLLARFVR